MMDQPPFLCLYGLLKSLTEKRQKGKIHHQLKDILFRAGMNLKYLESMIWGM